MARCMNVHVHAHTGTLKHMSLLLESQAKYNYHRNIHVYMFPMVYRDLREVKCVKE